MGVRQVAQDAVDARGECPPRHRAVRLEAGVGEVDHARAGVSPGEEVEEPEAAHPPVHDGQPHG